SPRRPPPSSHPSSSHPSPFSHSGLCVDRCEKMERDEKKMVEDGEWRGMRRRW
uniref:Uncharacterized protein n=1 Tax=Cucumis melo TaxID=3656 RepID=A0A9I9EJC1_CUCME